MALRVYGLAIVRDAATSVDFLSSGAYTCDDTDYAQDFGRDDVEATAGNLATVLVKRLIEKLTITITPMGVTFANAQAQAVLPAAMQVVTLSGSTLAQYNGTWNFISGGKIKSKKAGVTVMTYMLERYDGAALAEVAGD
jgi:hypothetical protein